jgi:hypothetical protein
MPGAREQVTQRLIDDRGSGLLVPDLHQGGQDLLAAAQPGQMTFFLQVEQLGVGQPGSGSLRVYPSIRKG